MRLPPPIAAAAGEAALLLFFSLCALLGTYPALLLLFAEPPHLIRDVFRDTSVLLWDLWHFREALSSGDYPLVSDRICHPEGTGLLLAPQAAFYGLLSLPFQWAIGGERGIAVALAALTLATFPATQVATFRWLRWLGGSRPAALFVSFFLPFSALRMLHLPRVTYLSHFWLPLIALWCGRGARESRPGLLLLGGAALVPAFLSDPHMALLAALFAAGDLGLLLVRGRLAWRAAAAAAGRVALGAGVASLPLLPAAWRELRSGPADSMEWQLEPGALAPGRQRILAPDPRGLLHLLSPDLSRALLGPPSPADVGLALEAEVPVAGLLESIRPAPPGPSWSGVALPLVFAALVAAGLLGPGRGRAVLSAAAGLFLLAAALGPHIGDGRMPGPYRLLALLVPPLRWSRHPAGLVAPALLLLSVPAVLGLSGLLDRLRALHRGAPPALLLVLGVLLAAQVPGYLAGPVRMEPLEVPEIYAALAEDPVPGAVLEHPLGQETLRRRELLGQTAHGRPIVGGLPHRLTERAGRFARTSPLVAALQAPHAAPPPPASLRAHLLGHGIRYVLVWTSLLPAADAAAALELLRSLGPAREISRGGATAFQFD